MLPTPARPSHAAAFFDVDGTLVQTTIVHYYMYFRKRRMSRVMGALWHAAFLLKCVYYFLLDKMNRSMLNVVFYKSYAGLPVREIRALVHGCYEDVIEPRLFRQAAACVEEHRRAGRRVVLVTGSIDFIVQPLAERLGVADVVAPALVESNGQFTGELDGPPIGDEEKARRIRRFAEEHDLDLARCFAYGDSIADRHMLEIVGHPAAVNPDRPLVAMAKSRGWPVLRWTLDGTRADARE